MLKLFLAISLCLAGCATGVEDPIPTRPLRVKLAAGYERYRPDLERAVAGWRGLAVVDQDDPLALPVDVGCGVGIVGAQGEFSRREWAVHVCDEGLGDSCSVSSTMAHELGHALGLGHLPRPSIMTRTCAEGYGTTMPTDGDVELASDLP